MFVPRALRLKGVREKSRPQPTKPASKAAAADGAEASRDDALVEAMQNASTNSPEYQPQPVEPNPIKNGPRFTTKPITPEYVAQLAAGIGLIFSDYAHQEEERAAWLREHYRSVDGEENYVHLAAILEHPNVSSLKPEASQVLLQQALREHPSPILQVSANGFYIRRKPASYPPKYLPHNSFEAVDDDGLAFWDQRTIYVEPHLRNICQTPAKVAYWLAEHGQLRPKWLPIQAVHTLWNSCAFVVLSGNVTPHDSWQKWRAAEKPQDWKILTKVEHTKRTAEYIALLENQNPNGMRKAMVADSELPPIARPAVLPMATEIVPEYPEMAEQQQQGKKKRKRRKAKSSKATDDAETNAAARDVQDADDAAPSSKRRG